MQRFWDGTQWTEHTDPTFDDAQRVIITIKAIGGTLDFDGQAVTLRRGKKKEKQIGLNDVESVRWLRAKGLGMGFVEVRVKGDDRSYCTSSSDATNSDNATTTGTSDGESTAAFLDALQRVGITCYEVTKESSRAEQAEKESAGLARPRDPGLGALIKDLAKTVVQPVDVSDSDIVQCKFQSHIAGINATVTVYADRIEYTKPKDVSAGRVTAAVATGGLSLVAGGVKSHKTGGTVIVPIRQITSVSSRNDGFRYSIMSVTTAGGTLEFRGTKDDIARAMPIIQRLILGCAAPTIIQVPIPVAVAEPTSASTASVQSVADQLLQLKSLLDAGVLTQDEYETKRAALVAQL